MNPFWLLQIWLAIWFPCVEPDKRQLQNENYRLREENGRLRQLAINNGLTYGAGRNYVEG